MKQAVSQRSLSIFPGPMHSSLFMFRMTMASEKGMAATVQWQAQNDHLQPEEVPMFLVIIHYPAIREDKEGDFREWFDWSNEEFGKCPGFVSRRLLRPLEGGNLAAILECISHDAFIAITKSPVHDEAARRVTPILEGSPKLSFFEVVA
jgi:heme-degrading monooxygenase HmoA